jgi:hypothetical protein
MTEAQIVRNLMAEAGVEMIPAEAETLVFVHNELMRLSKVPIKDLKKMVDPSSAGSVRVYETLKKIKRLRKNAKTKKSD